MIINTVEFNNIRCLRYNDNGHIKFLVTALKCVLRILRGQAFSGG